MTPGPALASSYRAAEGRRGTITGAIAGAMPGHGTTWHKLMLVLFGDMEYSSVSRETKKGI